MIMETDVMLHRREADGVTVYQASTAHQPAPDPAPAPAPAPEPAPDPEPAPPDRAIAILALAQRTADDHIAEARARAERILDEAHSYADGVRAEADRLLSDARAEAEHIVSGGTVYAEQLRLQAQQRYEDAVGGLSIKREALQRQIENLAAFDHDYRHRITLFLQSQLRALWAEHPQTMDVPGVGQQLPGGFADEIGPS
ncbi:DivIVA domain-containing protein [Actinoplanes sp. CA-252034]|uniref:DivIVA domain-containing protein n=1 Tax=Actinoplanes sp. CA-252034 TaxID=3239906 RepID=UPI003D962C6D